MGDVADQLDVGHEVGVDLGRHAVDDDDLLVAVGVPVLGGVLDQVIADRDDEVGVLEAGHLVVTCLQADRPDRARVLEVDQALGHEGLGHRDPGRLGERAQRAAGMAADGAVAGQRDRIVGGVDELGCALQLAHARLRLHRRAPREGSGLEGALHHVLGQLEMGRARLL